MRQVVLQIHTTGLDPLINRVCAIAMIELVNHMRTGNTIAQTLDPLQKLEPGAAEENGLTNEKLVGQPLFLNIADQVLGFCEQAEVIAHNMPFVESFVDQELKLMGYEPLSNHCYPKCLIGMQRTQHPDHRRGLNDMRKHYGIPDNIYSGKSAMARANLTTHIYQVLTGS
ncbi:MAG: hypothetical protein COB61_004150 [Thiotrichales bacterium]|nr:hypothetical protein [Thiotrichales bacterium]